MFCQVFWGVDQGKKMILFEVHFVEKLILMLYY